MPYNFQMMIYCEFHSFMQNKTTNEIIELKQSLETTLERLNLQSDEADKLTKSLNGRIDNLQYDLQSVQNELE